MILGDVVAEFRGSGGKLTGAVTRAGREIEAELAIVGVGVQPSTGYLDGCGVELDRGTVLVDERFATNVPGIYAVGDIANFSDPIFGHRRLIQHWTNANYQGEPPRPPAGGRGHALRPGRVLLLGGVRHQDRPPRRSRRRPRRARHARLARGRAR